LPATDEDHTGKTHSRRRYFRERRHNLPAQQSWQQSNTGRKSIKERKAKPLHHLATDVDAANARAVTQSMHPQRSSLLLVLSSLYAMASVTDAVIVT
jgi:hypothetical protein